MLFRNTDEKPAGAALRVLGTTFALLALMLVTLHPAAMQEAASAMMAMVN